MKKLLVILVSAILLGIFGITYDSSTQGVPMSTPTNSIFSSPLQSTRDINYLPSIHRQ